MNIQGLAYGQAHGGRGQAVINLLLIIMKKAIKVSVSFLVVCLMLMALPVTAQVDWGIEYAAKVGLGTAEVRDVAAKVVNTLLGLLGIVALIIILYGGFTWMTAAGSDEKIASAKKTIAAGIVGLIVIFFAYAIVMFVFNVVGGSLTSDGTW